ncbi:MAG: hypothetical protein JKY26_06480 [Pseudomonas sp.]|nr:hypothetical protein [Pseudomonas sp.]
MPEIKCEHGHPVHVSTPDFLAGLTVDQLRYAGERIEETLKKVDEQKKRIVWRVSKSGWVDGNYREEEFEKAADHLVRIFKEAFVKEAAGFVKDRCPVRFFKDSIPEIVPEIVSQHEYDTEWFPPAKS